MKIATWTKPGTTDIRVYFNGLGTDVKVFAVASDDNFEIKFSRDMYNSEKDSVMDRVDRELEEMNGGERVVKWADLLALVK